MILGMASSKSSHKLMVNALTNDASSMINISTVLRACAYR